MSFDFKEAFTYYLRDKSWKFKFGLLTIFIFINSISGILWKNFIVGIPFSLFIAGFTALLINNLINNINPVLPDLSIKKILKTGLKFYGVVFSYFAAYFVISIILLVAQFTLNIAIVAISYSHVGLFKTILPIVSAIFLVIIIIYALFSVIIFLFINLIFGENLSYKEALNIKKIISIFIKDWGKYLLLFSLFLLTFPPLILIYEISYVYDNKPILVLVCFLMAMVSTFNNLIFSNLLVQAYKQSLAKREQDNSKFESLKHSLNSFDYKIIGLIVFLSVSLTVISCLLPFSVDSPIGQLRKQMENTAKLHNFSKLSGPIYKTYHLNCQPDRYELKTPILFPILKNGKMGYIDKTGQVIIEPKFAFADDFYEGLALVNVGGSKRGRLTLYDKDIVGGKYGFIDTTGKFVIDPIFEYASRFIDGIAVVKFENKFKFIDKSGKYVENKAGFHNGLHNIKINNKQGFVDKSNKIVINPIYDEASIFSDGISIVENNGKMGAINTKGQTIIDIKYDYLSPFKEGLAIIVLKNKYGFINKKGKIVIPPRFNDACNFSEGLADVNVSGKLGYIDKTGKFVIPPKYEGNYGFINGIAPVRVGGKWGYINKNGDYIWMPTN